MKNIIKNDKPLLKSVCNIVDIYKYIFGVDYTTFSSNPMIIDACLMKLIVIGENVSRISDDYKKSHNEIEWREIKDLRNLIAHNYDAVNYDMIWEIIHEDIPDLEKLYINLLMTDYEYTIENLQENGVEISYLSSLDEIKDEIEMD